MNDFDKLKYQVQDLTLALEQLKKKNKNLLSFMSCEEVKNQIVLQKKVYIKGNNLFYESILIDGSNSSLSLYMNDNLIDSVNGKILSGKTMVSSKMVNIKVVAEGDKLSNLILKIEGEGLVIY